MDPGIYVLERNGNKHVATTGHNVPWDESFETGSGWMFFGIGVNEDYFLFATLVMKQMWMSKGTSNW